MKKIGLFLALSLFIAKIGLAATPMEVALINFKKGAYVQALTALKKVYSSKSKIMASKAYLQGICSSKLQKYDDAIKFFNRAISLSSEANDIYYELGQAYYANNDLEKARKTFGRSVNNGFKAPTSLYYQGHISQILEEFKEAKKYYNNLLIKGKGNPSILQIGRFQLAETLLSIAEPYPKKAKKLVENYVLPQMEEALEMNKTSGVGKDIKARMKEVQRKYDLDPDLLKNGRTLSEKRWSAQLWHETQYDNNTTNSTDLAQGQATQKDSFIHNTELRGSYLFNVAGRFTFKPNARIRNTHYEDRNSPEVFKNDAIKYRLGNKATWDYTLFGNQANTFIDAFFEHARQDQHQIKDKSTYSRTWSVILGEKFKLFPIGTTNFRLGHKYFGVYSQTVSTRTNSVSFDQSWQLKSGNLLLLFFQADFIDNFNNVTDSTNTYLTRLDFIMPKFSKGYTLNPFASITFTDTRRQKLARGTEKSFSPGLRLTKRVNKHVSALLTYTYTNKTSKNKAAFDFTKHVTSFELRLSL